MSFSTRTGNAIETRLSIAIISVLVAVGMVFSFLYPSLADAQILSASSATLQMGVTDGSAVNMSQAISLEDRFELSSVLDQSVETTASITPVEMDLDEIVLSGLALGSKKKSIDVVEKVAPKKRAGLSRRFAKVSWYGPGFYGKHTASGSVLKRDSMVLAHRSLPFGTRVAITFKGKTVIGTVRDRGPFISGRTFDLGPGVAKALDFNGVQTISYAIVD